MLNIIPVPKKIEAKSGTFNLKGCAVFVDDKTDSRVVRAAAVLCEEISRATCSVVPVSCGTPSGRAIVIDASGEGEAYTISAHEDRVVVRAGAAGAFYAIQSLRQLVAENGDTLPCFELEDAPNFAYRGFYHDITRGRVCTLEKLKEIVECLAYFKINSLQLYVEDAFTFREFEGIVTANEALTPGEIVELDEYCRERFIELIPSLSTFGHLFTLLQSEKYSHISELGRHEMTMNYWMEKQWHHTVDVYNPETIDVIGSMLEQYIPLFKSKYFNICCDETMDLCSGKNAGRDKGEAYFYHLNKIIDIVKSHGKTVMMWGDECMARPEMTKDHVPSDTIMLNWCYRKEVNEWIPKFFSELGFTQIVCPGTSCWDNFIEDIDTSVGNISSFAAHAKKYGALGILNTNWGDFGHVCAFNCNLYGMMFGAAKSWNESAAADEEFERTASFLLYGVREFNMADVLRSLGRAAATCNWSRFVMWHSDTTLGGKDVKFSFGDCLNESDAISSIDICQKERGRLSSLKRDDPVITDLILAARAIELMNREALYVNGVEGYGDGEALQRDFDSWLEEYSAAWLRDDKISGLPRLQDFIKNITKVKARN